MLRHKSKLHNRTTRVVEGFFWPIPPTRINGHLHQRTIRDSSQLHGSLSLLPSGRSYCRTYTSRLRD
ncbi:hypothetical protein M9458_055585, partial [Cirrhinus mrigala]